jgi:hypothetical protein
MDKKTKVVIFNAPPRAGKDIACKHMLSLINNSVEGFSVAHHLSFKETLIGMTSLVFGMSVERFMLNYDEGCDGFWHKDKLQADLRIGNEIFSQRSALIYVSENVAKPVFGDAVFGIALADKIASHEGIMFVSDGGFGSELKPVVNEVGVTNVLVVQVYRDGCSFENDSRNYIDPGTYPEVSFIEVENNGSLDDYFNDIEQVVKSFTINLFT